ARCPVAPGYGGARIADGAGDPRRPRGPCRVARGPPGTGPGAGSLGPDGRRGVAPAPGRRRAGRGRMACVDPADPGAGKSLGTDRARDRGSSGAREASRGLRAARGMPGARRGIRGLNGVVRGGGLVLRLARECRWVGAVAKPSYIELGSGRTAVRIPILYEDRAVLAVDKPRGWMLVPFTWQRTGRNLQAAIQSSIGAGAFWARSRNRRFLRYVHRLDADTTGVLLMGKTPGVVRSFGELFESRVVEKRYLAVVHGVPRRDEWTCRLRIDRDPEQVGRMRVS